MASDVLKKIHRKFENRLAKLVTTDEDFSSLSLAIKNTTGTVMGGLSRDETTKFDITWIEQLETGVFALEKIAKNPKKFLKEDDQVVPIELARKVGSRSVQHLASHSQFVKDIKEDGSVVPEKILNLAMDEDYGIYENRFIMTLMKKLIIFVELRYDYVTKHSESFNSDIITYSKKLEIDGAVYEVETKIKCSIPSGTKAERQVNQDLLERITLIRRRVMFLMGTEFYKSIKDCKPVNNPIQQTNIIRKHPDYHACYLLWRFIDQYDALGISFDVDESKVAIEGSYLDSLYGMILASYAAIRSDKMKDADITKIKTKKYTVKPTVDLDITDKDLSDDKFLHKYFSPDTEIILSSLTEEEKAKLKEKEKANAKKALDKKKAKELAKKEKARLKKLEKALALKKQKEEEKKAALKAKKAAARERERERAKKRKEAEKQKILKAKEEEKKRYEREIDRLRRTRKHVKKEALETNPTATTNASTPTPPKEENK